MLSKICMSFKPVGAGVAPGKIIAEMRLAIVRAGISLRPDPTFYLVCTQTVAIDLNSIVVTSVWRQTASLRAHEVFIQKTFGEPLAAGAINLEITCVDSGARPAPPLQLSAAGPATYSPP